MGTVKEILLQFFVALLCVGSLAGLLMGIAMLLRPEQLKRVNDHFSRWVSAEKVTEPLDRPRWTERFFYRHHRLVGSVVFLGAAFILYTFLFNYNVRRIAGALASRYWGLLDVLIGVVVVFSALAGMIGLLVLMRPSVLRDIEKISNRWVSTDGMTNYFDKMFHSVDEQILRRRKIAGGFLIIGSLYILAQLGSFLIHGGLKLS